MALNSKELDLSGLSIATAQDAPEAPEAPHALHQASRLATLNLPNRVVRKYLGDHSEVFHELDLLREKVSVASKKIERRH